MEVLKILIGVVLPYITIVVLVGGMIYRIVKWYKMPSPGKLTLFPAPPPGSGLVIGILKETFFLRTLFKSDKVLWAGSWAFHIMLLLLLVSHLRLLGSFSRSWRVLGIDDATVGTMSTALGSVAGLIIMMTGIFLLIRRLALTRVRQISLFADYLILILLISIILTGYYMRFNIYLPVDLPVAYCDLYEMRDYVAGLLTFNPRLPSSSLFLFHFLLGQILLMCIPFSKIMHFGGIFFSQTLVQRR